ncbi:hypothetical protein BG011_008551 [Mortierella polycephala]|uniref:Ubiquitin-like protease family profile domain-containing protein n=1 Tax=Mortierella polycephala TaxID=41804 RepID=A0A9P6QBN9_9FUNG|nr:hypothetical protein BG011_008551 [Mortierella polycephala]
MNSPEKGDTEDSVQLVREPVISLGTKKQGKGVPIEVPTTQRRLSTFSVENGNPALLTGFRDGGSSRRKSSTSMQGQSPISPPFNGHNNDYDVVGTIAGYSKPHSDRGKTRPSEVDLLCEEDEHKDTRMAKRRKSGHEEGSLQKAPIASSEHGSGSIISRMKRHSTSSETKASLFSSVGTLPLNPSLTTSSSAQISSSSSAASHSPSRQKPFILAGPLSDKAKALGLGAFPQANLVSVRLGSAMEFTNPGMMIQFGPDRFILNVDKNVTKVDHTSLKFVEYHADGDIKVITIATKEKLVETSVLAQHYDPTPHSGKSRKIILFSDVDSATLLDYCRKLQRKKIDVRPLSSEATEKILQTTNMSITRTSARLRTSIQQPQSHRKPQSDDVLFLFPFKSSAKSKSIAVHNEDMSRLNEGEFLNDTLIEFGLKHVHYNLETKHSELAQNTYIFNSFFYQRLLAKPGKGMSSSYDSIKSWTNKIDLFSKKFIIVPIHENVHWYLAIITNPGLLLKQEDDSQNTTPSPPVEGSDDSETKPPSSPSDSATEPPSRTATPSLHDNVVKGSGPLEEKVTKKDSDSDPWPRKRVLRSTPAIPIDAEEKPYILVLDSLGGSHPTVFKTLRSYLQHELLNRKNIQKTISSKMVPGRYAKCPQQENFCDCGLFLLHYAEVFLKNPGPLLDRIVNKSNDMTKYWAIGDLADKREKYREIMISLTEQYKAYLFTQEEIEGIKENLNHPIGALSRIEEEHHEKIHPSKDVGSSSSPSSRTSNVDMDEG